MAHLENAHSTVISHDKSELHSREKGSEVKAEAESSSAQVLVHGYLDKDMIAFLADFASGSTILGTQETDEAEAKESLLSLRQLLGLFGSIQRLVVEVQGGDRHPMLWLKLVTPTNSKQGLHEIT